MPPVSPRPSAPPPSVQNYQVQKSPKMKEDRKCSWCGETCTHQRTSHHISKRSKYQCEKCLRSTVRCRNPACHGMARAQRGWHEGFCIDHTPLYRETSVTGYCSWCFKKTDHSIQNDSLMNKVSLGKVFACNSCHRGTQHCKKCDEAMCRVSERGAVHKCLKCCGLIDSWEIGPEACHKAIEKTAWCPWCYNNCKHEIKVHYKGKETKHDVFQCTECASETRQCKCGNAMIINTTHDTPRKCLACHDKAGDDFWKRTQTKFQGLCNNYSLDQAKADMNRKSAFRDRAVEAGLLHPFQLLVSMHPQMRSGTAFRLEIPLLQEECLGKTHEEADMILFDKKRGLQRRTSSILESMKIKSKCNWYTILRRAIHDLSDSESSFKSEKAKNTMGECSDPSSDVVAALEMELLDHLARRHLMMIPAKLRNKAIEMYQHDEVYHMFDRVHTGGMPADNVCLMFLAIMISTGMQEEKLDMDIDKIQLDTFIVYLRSYLHGESSMGDRVHKAQFATTQIVFFIARVIVVGTLVQIACTAIFPPAAPFVGAVLFTVGVGLFVAAFVFRPTRGIACQATLIIVVQHFLLLTSDVHLDPAAADYIDYTEQNENSVEEYNGEGSLTE